MLILVLLTVLIAAVARSSVNANNTSTQVLSRNQALAAADAGVQTALFRLNTNGSTSAGNGTLGSGATYSYTVTSLGNSSTPCAGLWVQNAGASVLQSCVTATGTANGVTTRVQERLAGSPALFPINGILAVNGFSAGNNFTDVGDIGSNGPISIGGGQSSVTGHVKYLSSANPTPPSCPGSGCTLVTLPSPLTVPASAASASAAYASAAASNLDGTIGFNGYDSITHTIDDTSNNASNYSLPAGTYYFCNLSFKNGASFTAPATNTGPVVVYLDSSYDGSACAGASPNGTISAKNNFTITNSTGIPSYFQLYVYGQPGCTISCPPNLDQNNLTVTNAQIFAPYSSMTVKNNFTMTGDLVVGELSMSNNATFNYTSASGGSGSRTYYFPAAHQICNSSGSC